MNIDQLVYKRVSDQEICDLNLFILIRKNIVKILKNLLYMMINKLIKKKSKIMISGSKSMGQTNQI